MTKALTPEDVANMTQEEREDLASRMLNPIKICNPKLSAKEKNKIIKDANPRWSEEELKPYLFDEGEDK